MCSGGNRAARIESLRSDTKPRGGCSNWWSRLHAEGQWAEESNFR